MRYLNIDTVTFTDINGNQFPVKDIREIEDKPISYEVEINQNTLLDEVAVKTFGDFAEGQSYRIFDKNIVALTEASFDLTKIRSLKIPV